MGPNKQQAFVGFYLLGFTPCGSSTPHGGSGFGEERTALEACEGVVISQGHGNCDSAASPTLGSETAEASCQLRRFHESEPGEKERLLGV